MSTLKKRTNKICDLAAAENLSLEEAKAAEGSRLARKQQARTYVIYCIHKWMYFLEASF
jgi:hypothetical protein